MLLRRAHSPLIAEGAEPFDIGCGSLITENTGCIDQRDFACSAVVIGLSSVHPMQLFDKLFLGGIPVPFGRSSLCFLIRLRMLFLLFHIPVWLPPSKLALLLFIGEQIWSRLMLLSLAYTIGIDLGSGVQILP